MLVTVLGADEAPTGTLGQRALRFFPFGADGAYVALVGLGVEHPPGELPVVVRALEASEAVELEGAFDVRPPSFRRRSLTVARRFTQPSERERARTASDGRAFARAFSQPWQGALFEADFDWPRRDVVAAPFGDLRVFNDQRRSQHLGTDLDGEVGDPVTAANAGEVVLVRDCFASGNTVLLHHGGRLFTAYFHLSRFDVKLGDRVTRGQQVGLVGSTGRVTGPHLHFGVKLDGLWVNPESLMTLRFGDAPPPRP